MIGERSSPANGDYFVPPCLSSLIKYCYEINTYFLNFLVMLVCSDLNISYRFFVINISSSMATSVISLRLSEDVGLLLVDIDFG